MFVKRYLLLVLVLLQFAVVAESRAGEYFSSSYYNESVAPSSIFSPRAWASDGAGYNMPERFRNQRKKNEPRTSNPWALSVTQWAPAMPQHLDPVFRTNGFSKMPQYMTQTGKQNTLSQQGSRSQNYRSYGQPTPSVSPEQPYAKSAWSSRPVRAGAAAAAMDRFQQNPRFVTPDILDKLNRQQTQTQRTFPFSGKQNGSQRKPLCCQNRQRRMTHQTDTQRTYQQVNKQHTEQDYGYSNRSAMPFTLDAGQLNRERLLYMGDSLPTVPDAAISGLPPMNVFEPLPPVLSGAGYSGAGNGIDWGTNRYSVGPYGDFLQP